MGKACLQRDNALFHIQLETLINKILWSLNPVSWHLNDYRTILGGSINVKTFLELVLINDVIEAA